jgi:hypothetical protein
MNGEDTKQGRNNPDGQNCPFHDESFLVNVYVFWPYIHLEGATLIPSEFPQRHET